MAPALVQSVVNVVSHDKKYNPEVEIVREQCKALLSPVA